MTVPIPFDWLFLGLRIAFVGLLYLFLWQVLRIVMRDLRSQQTAPSRRRPTKARLILVEPADSGLAPGSSFAIGNHATIGRHPDCTVTIDDPTLSAIHAEFRRAKDAWYVLDHESTNGTRVDGRTVAGATFVEDGDAVQLGRVAFRFES